MRVTPKKHLGQHFLLDTTIAHDIVAAMTYHTGYHNLLEIGPGTGVLTDYILKSTKPLNYVCVELDAESVRYLHLKYPDLNVLESDFLQMDLKALFGSNFGIIGNFPYNISSQIFFKVLDYKDSVDEVVCMLQKEVATRLCSGPGGRDYGILSVFLQVWYDMEYLFTVPEHVFDPPPKVQSGVIRARRNTNQTLGCNEALFRKVVKQAFSMRRKTMRNAFKAFQLPKSVSELPVFDQRAETLSWQEFVTLTNLIFPEQGPEVKK